MLGTHTPFLDPLFVLQPTAAVQRMDASQQRGGWAQADQGTAGSDTQLANRSPLDTLSRPFERVALRQVLLPCFLLSSKFLIHTAKPQNAYPVRR